MCGVGAGRACRHEDGLSWLPPCAVAALLFRVPPHTCGMCHIEPLNLGVLLVSPTCGSECQGDSEGLTPRLCRKSSGAQLCPNQLFNDSSFSSGLI